MDSHTTTLAKSEIFREKLEKINKIANNVLYLGDSSDYGSALWEILAVLNPAKFPQNGDIPDLEWIVEE
jgi:hypothetical protein